MIRRLMHLILPFNPSHDQEIDEQATKLKENVLKEVDHEKEKLAATT